MYTGETSLLLQIDSLLIARNITWRIHQTPSRRSAPAMAQVMRVASILIFHIPIRGGTDAATVNCLLDFFVKRPAVI
jgi:hypothetical protein